jgi:flagellar hook-associated protein FlgK
VQMIQFQSAYQAAARVVTTVDEMLQSLLAI